jgi:hypothetical protein
MSDIGTKRHFGWMGLSLAAGQDRFSNPFILVMAALAGYGATAPQQDVNSIDGRLSCRLPRRSEIDFLVKNIRTVACCATAPVGRPLPAPCRPTTKGP